MNWDWLLGFIEGDGCFTLGITKGNGRYTSLKISPRISIAQKEDMEVIIKIKEFLMKFDITSSICVKNNRGKYYSLTIGDSSAMRCIKYLDKLTFNSKKYKDYLKWKECCKLIKNKEHYTKKGILKIIDIFETMNLSKNKQKLLKYNKKNVNKLFKEGKLFEINKSLKNKINNDNSKNSRFKKGHKNLYKGGKNGKEDKSE